jgi:hypothetical protein
MDQKNVGDSVRAGCGDKPHVRFGRGGLVLLSNQDPAFYLTSDLGKAQDMAKGNRSLKSEKSEVYEMYTAVACQLRA